MFLVTYIANNGSVRAVRVASVARVTRTKKGGKSHEKNRGKEVSKGRGQGKGDGQAQAGKHQVQGRSLSYAF